MHPYVITGLDRIAQPLADRDDVCRGVIQLLDRSRFAVLMNQASLTADLRPADTVLTQRFPNRLRAIFTPQHGLWGEQQANMIESPHGNHADLNVPVYSLYSETRRPTPNMLNGIDALVVDLQDVGTRVYTFIWTVSHCMEVCAELGIPVVVLDRPNPLGGEIVEGPCLDPAFVSFVGRASIPMRHGLTLGELAQFVNRELGIGAELMVVPCENWRRSMTFEECGRHWVYPSPNVAHWPSVAVYPGQVLLEGTNLSEGRGTTMPFEVCGAPFVEPSRLIGEIEKFDLPGARFLPIRFAPTFDKWQGSSCGGVMIQRLDGNAFRPYATSVAILSCVKRLWPNEFAWLPPPYEYETVLPPIDIISGSDRLRTALDSEPPWSESELAELVHCDVDGWWARVKKAESLLY